MPTYSFIGSAATLTTSGSFTPADTDYEFSGTAKAVSTSGIPLGNINVTIKDAASASTCGGSAIITPGESGLHLETSENVVTVTGTLPSITSTFTGQQETLIVLPKKRLSN